MNPLSPFIPFALVCAGLLALMISEIRLINERAANLQEQRAAREQTVDQARATQRKLEEIVNGLLDLAPEDAAARAIIEKHGIRRVQNDAGAPAPAPDATPAP